MSSCGVAHSARFSHAWCAIAAATGVTKMDLFRPPYGSGAEIEWVNRVIARQHASATVVSSA